MMRTYPHPRLQSLCRKSLPKRKRVKQSRTRARLRQLSFLR